MRLSTVGQNWPLGIRNGFCAYELLAQLCLTRCGPVDCSPLGFSVHGIFQARIFPSAGDLPHPGTEPGSPALLMSDSSPPHGLQPTRLIRPCDFPGKSTGVGCHCLLHEQDPRDAKGQGGLVQSMWSQRVVHN